MTKIAFNLFEKNDNYVTLILRWCIVVNLINKNDKDVISSAGFIKNAVFYKDLIAFYDAYNNLMQQKVSKLPAYCYKKGTYYLEGICLLFKDYASELGFESVRLSLDYLKVLYYTIASYSTDGSLPERDLLISEFNVYKKASIELAVSSSSELEEAKSKFAENKKDYEKTQNSYSKNLVFARLLEGFSTVIAVITVIVAMLSYTCYFMGKFTMLTATIGAIIVLVVGFGIFGLMRLLAKRKQNNANGINYSLQGKKKKKDNEELEYTKVLEKFNKINSEKYEYNSSFANELKKFAKTLEFEEVIERANEYKMLSYNMKLDLNNLFETQEQEIKEIIEVINSVTNPENSEKDFEKIYQEISSKDWLYFNNEVRFEFIKRMADVSEFTYNYTVKVKGKKINPFGISVKALSKEPIVYLRSNDDLFISATLDKFLSTKYIKNTKTLELKGLKSSDALKRVKMEFASHFFDYESTIKYNNLFHATKLHDGIKIPADIIENNRKVPTYVYMKLKLIEARLGLSNSEASTIKQLASLVEKFEETGEFDKMEISADLTQDDKSSVTSESCTYEDLGYAVKYTFEDGSFIGYRLDNII